jgi:hypothetical protein
VACDVDGVGLVFWTLYFVVVSVFIVAFGAIAAVGLTSGGTVVEKLATVALSVATIAFFTWFFIIRLIEPDQPQGQE